MTWANAVCLAHIFIVSSSIMLKVPWLFLFLQKSYPKKKLVYFMEHLVLDLAAKTATGMNIVMWTTSQQELKFQTISCLLMKRSMYSVNVLQKDLIDH